MNRAILPPTLLLLCLLTGCFWSGSKDEARHWCRAHDVARILKSQKPQKSDSRITFIQYPPGTNRVTFYNDSRRMELNGTLVWLNAAPHGNPRSRKWRMLREDLTNILQEVWAPSLIPTNRLVMLDPGHGGKDQGAATDDGLLLEKNLTLDIALRVRATLQARGLNVLLTRDDDTTLTLSNRTDAAQAASPGLFVSIHLNKAANTNSFGVETFVLPAPGFAGTADTSKPDAFRPGNAFDPASSRLAYAIHRRLHPLAGFDRGVKRARFAVLANASSPAVLVECGFLSNPDEATRFETPLHKANIARAISEGIFEYLGN